MKIRITKSARQFGYIIWNNKHQDELYMMLEGKTSVSLSFNGFMLGAKPIDWKYHRISLG